MRPFYVIVVLAGSAALSTARRATASASLAQGPGPRQQPSANPSVRQILQLFIRGAGNSEREGPTQVAPATNKQGSMPHCQKISVIGAGHGRSGTSTLVQALSRLGLKSYHMKDGVFETPGHLELWHDYYVKKSVGIDDVLDRLERDGFNATMDAPVNFYYERLMQRNPEALVILNLRKGGGAAWAASFHSSVFLIIPLLRRAPFRWFSTANLQSEFFDSMFRQDMGVPLDPSTGVPELGGMVESYEPWNRGVESSVPKSRLLKFHVQDGWAPLCRFLSPVSPEVRANCDQVLERGEPFPHVNDTAFIQRVVAFMRILCLAAEVMIPGVLVAAVIAAGTKTLVRMRRGSPRPVTSLKPKVF